MPQIAHKLAAQLWPNRPVESLSSVSDAELLRQFSQQADETAFSEIVRRHGPMVWGVCQRMLRHRQDTEDAFQATFIVLARKASSVGRRGLLTNWLFGVARRASLCLRRCRCKRQQRERSSDSIVEQAGNYSHSFLDEDSVLDQELARLPSKYRLPLLLCGLDGLTHHEAGKQLSWPTGTVAGRLSRGRRLLQLRLRRRGIEVPGAILLGGLLHSSSMALSIQRLLPGILQAIALEKGNGTATVAITGSLGYLVQQLSAELLWQRILSYSLALISCIALLGIGVWMRQTTLYDHPISTNRVASITPNAIPTLTESPLPMIALPEDAKATVVQWDQLHRETGRRMNSLQIQADGWVTYKTFDGDKQSGDTLRDHLSQSELQLLLSFMVNESDFFELDSERMKRDIQAEYAYDGSARNPGDVTLTRLRVRADGRQHEVQWDQLGSSHVYFGHYPEVRRLILVEGRLRNLLAIMQAGGQQLVQQVADSLNQQLAFTYPSLTPFTAADLWAIRDVPDSATRQYTFSRGDKYHGTEFFSATFAVPHQGSPRIVSTIPFASSQPPQFPRWPEPRCFEELDGIP